MLAPNPTDWTVMDIGCGQKGIIAQAWWEPHIKQGYAVDIHTIKPPPEKWTPLIMDAENLVSRLGPKSVDFTTHCGLLEHLEYEKALNVLKQIEAVTRHCIFFTMSAILRDADHKANLDGNPYHKYKSFWDAPTLEILGYHVDRPRMIAGETFQEEIVGWAIPSTLPKSEERWEKAKQHLIQRRCHYHPHEPVAYNILTNQCLSITPALSIIPHLTQGIASYPNASSWTHRDPSLLHTPFNRPRLPVTKKG